jgi:hypothetical protein
VLSSYDIIDEIIDEARKVDPNASSVLDACEAFYMNGTPDELSGDVDSPTGHFYRVARWIVQCDTLGFKHLLTFKDDAEAQAEFQKLDKTYGDWCEKEDC